MYFNFTINYNEISLFRDTNILQDIGVGLLFDDYALLDLKVIPRTVFISVW